MDAASSSIVAAASAGTPGTVQGAAAISVLKKAIDLRASSALQLVEALPKVPIPMPAPMPTSTPASAGDVGTKLDTFA